MPVAMTGGAPEAAIEGALAGYKPSRTTTTDGWASVSWWVSSRSV
jgi:hypothetical protein